MLSLKQSGYYHEYENTNIDNACSLRKNMTKQERRLWYCFLKGYPVKIYRQRTIGKYIVDFYCSKANLAIEVDGGQHYEAKGLSCDKRRTYELEEKGIAVLRFTNTDIDRNFESVCMEIDNMIKIRM